MTSSFGLLRSRIGSGIWLPVKWLDSMNEPLYFAMFVVLGFMVFIWFGLCIWVFRRLESQHPQKYVDLGSPSLFLRINIQNDWRFLRFLWKSEYNSLNDPSLSRTCNFMKIFFVVYCLLMLSRLFQFFLSFVKTR